MTEQRLESVEVPKEIYNEMVRQIEWLECLEAAGVDNWEGISHAVDMMTGEEND